ncbi:MAG: hypothetical protein ACREAA_00775 [Candidatus Polarisedimenticolia bacterium]
MRYPIPLLAILLAMSLCVAQEPSPASTSADCARWSIKGVALGMALKEVKVAHENLKHGRNWFRPDDRGRDWYFWVESRMQGLYNYVLPERDEPDGKIISVIALLDVSESSPSATIDALIERWGPPSAREVPIAKVRYFNAFGAPRGEFDWLATTWEDPGCDILVTVLDKTKVPPVPGMPPFKEVTLSLDSISKLVEKKEAELDKARDAVRP